MAEKRYLHEIDGSRLASLNAAELERLLDMRVEDLRQYRKEYRYKDLDCTTTVFQYVCLIQEVTNAMLSIGAKRHSHVYAEPPLFIPPLYESNSKG